MSDRVLPGRFRAASVAALASALAALALLFASSGESREAEAATEAAAIEAESLVSTSRGSRSLLSRETFDPALDRFVAEWDDELAALSIEPLLQERLVDELASGRVLWGATVILEIGTGRVLAMAEHSEREPGRRVALSPVAPAASVFKIISAAAVLRAGVDPTHRLCSRGGKRRLAPKHLVADARRDWRCQSFETVLPYSSNVAMARLVDGFVDAGELRAEADRWGFDRALPFPMRVVRSTASFDPEDSFSRAQAAAGFGEVQLSALHAAVIVATVAQRGVMVGPRIIDATTGWRDPAQMPATQILSPDDAVDLAEMLRGVVENGTASRSFALAREPLSSLSVAGKTGTLMDYQRHVDTTWFVGFAPADVPEVAIATVVVNDWNLWWVKALTVARRALTAYFDERGLHPRPPLPSIFRLVDGHRVKRRGDAGSADEPAVGP